MGPAAQTLLVVEDDASLRLLCRVNLELEGFRVLEAETLTAARAALADETIEAVLLDVHVGEEDGLELLRELRSERPSVAVALFTGSAQVDADMRSTADEVLAKPFALQDLSTTVQRLMERSGAGRQSDTFAE